VSGETLGREHGEFEAMSDSDGSHDGDGPGANNAPPPQAADHPSPPRNSSPPQPVGPRWVPSPPDGIDDVRAVWVEVQEPTTRWIEGVVIHCVGAALIAVAVFVGGLIVGAMFR
jgi:hypothetical protein